MKSGGGDEILQPSWDPVPASREGFSEKVMLALSLQDAEEVPAPGVGREGRV